MKFMQKQIELNGKQLIIETGEMAKQAAGAVKVTYGETVILAACCYEKKAEDPGFFPLTVDYRERTYAAGKIPGGFFKREGRPHEKEVITSRLIDRPIRPLFPAGYYDEIMIMITVLSADLENDPDIPAIIGASCATALSPVPFEGPIGAVRIGRINGEFIVNPTFEQLESSDLELIVAGTKSGITMLEGQSDSTTEETLLDAIEFAKPLIDRVIDLQSAIVESVGSEKLEFEAPTVPEELKEEVKKKAADGINEILGSALSKADRSAGLKKLQEEIIKELAPDDETGEKTKNIKTAMGKLNKELLRAFLKEKGTRVDGRKPDDLRPIDCKIGILPRTHGSGMFTKGETQALAVMTLGTKHDQQIMDVLEGEYKKRFMLHYNFPPYSVGEVRPNRGPGRREIGHGLLAEKALSPVIPDKEDFPYTLRLVSDILESNGSSSMATVCAGTLAMMDAGVPIKNPVAGVGLGIIDGIILTDIMGDEDHAGDMDFKVAGTRQGITAIQMDIKISSISMEILEKALAQAKIARMKTLDEIEKAISKPREEISKYAPQIVTVTIDPAKIGALIGPGGKNVKAIQEETEAVIEIDDDGTVAISSISKEKMDRAVMLVKAYTDEVEEGKIYTGTVKNVVDFGAFVEVIPGKEGLVHISELAPYRVAKVTDVVNVGDTVRVKCILIDERGRIKLSRTKALEPDELEKEKNND
ncbi:MAG: polyribonucleotide nucleotidyltransferase [Elusimicrobiota bacterium]